MWMDEADTEREVRWGREFMETMKPWATETAPPNFINDDRGERLRASYGEETYARLVALKNEYDPDNVFALNQNIPPG
jgi:FAD/FMN-containing dehydrogenase